VFSLERRRLRGDLTVALQYLKGAYKQERRNFSCEWKSERTRKTSFELKEGRDSSDVKGKVFTQRTARPWHCPRLWVPHPWRCLRLWMGPGQPEQGGTQPTAGVALRSLPTHPFCNFMIAGLQLLHCDHSMHG